MKKAGIFMIAGGLITAPVQAADWSDVRPGTFIGARLTIGGRTGGRPSAALTIAPTQNRISQNGIGDMTIGEGLALNLTPGARPTLTLAGVRADTALGLQRDRDVDSGKKLGMSTAGWVAVGVGSAALIFGGLYLAADHIADCNEGECD